MFGFLKNKLKEWVDKAKDTIKPTEETEELEITKKTIKEEKPKKKKKEKTKPEIELSKEELKKAEELIEATKEKKIEEVPLEFNPALNKYEPDLLKIKEKAKLESSVSVETNTALQKKTGFLKKIFGKKERNLESSEVKTSEPAIQKSFFEKVKSTFTYKISEEDFNRLFEDLEMLLLENNVALEVVEDLKKSLSKKLVGKEIKKDSLEKEIKTELKNSLNELIINPENPLGKIKTKKQEKKEPFIILFFGINGSGKTTSIAKLTNLLKENNLSSVLAAADTFRAASIEQISEHASKLNVPLIKHDYQSDPSAVGFDAIKYAKNHKIDVVLIDTAGRMHTKTNLLSEMEKIVRVTNPDLKIFVAESIAGNDATEQAKTFNEMIGIDGSILSKADIDEKGGTIISVSHATKKPIFYLGTGQNYKDLKLFNKEEYIESLGL